MLAVAGGSTWTQILIIIVGGIIVGLLTWIGARVTGAVRDERNDRRQDRELLMGLHRSIAGEPASDLMPQRRVGIAEMVQDMHGRAVYSDGVIILNIHSRLTALETWQTGAEKWRLDAQSEWSHHIASRSTPSD
jgi:hypothetical protein